MKSKQDLSAIGIGISVVAWRKRLSPPASTSVKLIRVPMVGVGPGSGWRYKRQRDHS
jgi:hypothetical protein